MRRVALFGLATLLGACASASLGLAWSDDLTTWTRPGMQGVVQRAR